MAHSIAEPSLMELEPTSIVRLTAPLPDPCVSAALDEIFFAASNTRAFYDPEEKAAFRWRWLGRYLENANDSALVAIRVGEIAGYLVGAFDDPARGERFSDIGYFRELADLTRQYPAHLHINLDPRFRNRGIGQSLIQAFLADVRLVGAPGVHVVTGEGARNVGFYRRCGFTELRAFDWQGRRLVMLGRKA